MSDQPNMKAGSREISLAASTNAPFIYFEEALAFGHLNGIVLITLEAQRIIPNPQAVIIDRVIVAHLRMNVVAALSLKKAIEDALLLATPAVGAS